MNTIFKKLSANWKKLVIIGAVVIAALVPVLLNLDAIRDFWRRTFSSPKDYYHYVERNAAEEFSSDAGELYERYFLERLHISDRCVSAEVEMTIGEGGRELMKLADFSGVNLSWIESLSLDLESAVNKDALAMGMGVIVNEADILTGNVFFDLNDEVLYLQIPEINERYMGLRMQGSDFGDWQEVLEMSEAARRICPDREVMERLLERYLMTAVESVEDVSKDKEVLKAEGIEQKCTVLTVTVDKSTCRAIAEKLLRKMREDKDIEEIIKDAAAESGVFADAFYMEDMSPEEACGRFKEWIDGELEGLEDSDADDEELLEMKVYVDDESRIVGRTIEMEDVEIRMLMPENGKQFGCEIFCRNPRGEEMALTGTGIRNEESIDGEFVLEYEDTSILDIEVKDLNTNDLKKGMINGVIVLGLSDEADELLGYTPGISVIQGMELSMDFQSDEDSRTCGINVSMRGRDIVDIRMSYSWDEKGNAGVNPGNNAVMIEDEDDMAEWGRELQLRGLADSLKAANAPSEVTDVLDFAADMDMDTLLRTAYYYTGY